ncbi:hypothetical protein KAR91_53265 [Candidatus Pacearchaeota archaeon]|nr:hypothetical protein [Candidatus Pacearchaeota archaeon]
MATPRETETELQLIDFTKDDFDPESEIWHCLEMQDNIWRETVKKICDIYVEAGWLEIDA